MRALVRRMVNEGHELASHTVHHPHLGSLSSSQINAELAGVENTVRSLFGSRRVTLFRAPFGLLITVILAFAFVCVMAALLGAAVNRMARSFPRNMWLTTSLLLLTVVMALLVPARSSIAHFAGDIITRDRGYRGMPARIAAGTDSLRRDLATQNHNVAIIVVESWGVLAESAAHNRWLDLFRTPALQQRYRVRTGQVPFRGGTTSGELRELCGVLTD